MDLKGLDRDAIEKLIVLKLSKGIEEDAARTPDAESLEYIAEVNIERIEKLGKDLYKIFFDYTIGHEGSHIIDDDHGIPEIHCSSFIIIDESLQVKETSKMLESAESHLNRDLEEEQELLTRSPYEELNPEKYTKAKSLFEEVLSVDPENVRAKEGLRACDEMLEPYDLHVLVHKVKKQELNDYDQT